MTCLYCGDDGWYQHRPCPTIRTRKCTSSCSWCQLWPCEHCTTGRRELDRLRKEAHRG